MPASRSRTRMMDPISLISTGFAFFVVAASPGPATISTATVALRQGRRTGLLYGLGLSFGLMFWGLVAASGVGAVLQSSLLVLTLLKVLGGLYLLWLAFQSGRSALRPETGTQVISEGRNWFLRGLLLNLSNPKAVVAWMAALSVGLDTTSDGGSLLVATAACAAIGFATYALYAVVFSIRGMMIGYMRFRRATEGTVAALFAVAGFGLIRSAFAR
jgi:threonine efflux protein